MRLRIQGIDQPLDLVVCEQEDVVSFTLHVPDIGLTGFHRPLKLPARYWLPPGVKVEMVEPDLVEELEADRVLVFLVRCLGVKRVWLVAENEAQGFELEATDSNAVEMKASEDETSTTVSREGVCTFKGEVKIPRSACLHIVGEVDNSSGSPA